MSGTFGAGCRTSVLTLLLGNQSAECGLRGSDAGDRNPERRAADVIDSRLVKEGDAVGVSAVLAADAELESGLRLPPALTRDPHQLADPRLIDRLEGTA